MALALKIGELDEDTFAASAVSTKRCSGCDPDVPGHCTPHRCLKCRGTMMEPLSFQSTVAELSASKKEAVRDVSGKVGRRFQRRTFEGDDDMQGDLDY
jgi:hypothetical protein